MSANQFLLSDCGLMGPEYQMDEADKQYLNQRSVVSGAQATAPDRTGDKLKVIDILERSTCVH